MPLHNTQKLSINQIKINKIKDIYPDGPEYSIKETAKKEQQQKTKKTYIK